jgi:DNA-binding transcriptional ArsR family regulator
MEPAGERDLCRLVSVFSTSTRQRIIKLLGSGSSYTFTEILNHLRTFDDSVRSNNLSYHLKELGDLIEQNEKAEYRITPKGLYVKEILDDLEATAAVPNEEAGKEQALRVGTGIEKVVIGGMLVKLSPGNFVRMAKEAGKLVIHSKIGAFRPKELYITCIDGISYYCKSKRMLEGLESVAEATRIEVPKNMIVDI